MCSIQMMACVVLSVAISATSSSTSRSVSPARSRREAAAGRARPSPWRARDAFCPAAEAVRPAPGSSPPGPCRPAPRKAARSRLGARQPAAEGRRREDVFEDGQVRKGLRDLERAHDAQARPQVGGHPGEVPPGEAQGAAVGRDRPGDEVEDRALPRPVGPDHAETRAGLERERHVVGDDDRAVPLAESGNLQPRGLHLSYTSCERSFSSASTGICGAVAFDTISSS